MEYFNSKGSLLNSLLCSLIIVLSGLTNVTYSQPLSCLNEINVSLDALCESTLEPLDILASGNSTGPYSLVLTTAAGTVLPANKIVDTHLWTTLTAEVTDSNNNSCWGYVYVEDKNGPTITCADITIECYDMNSYVPTATDGCTDATVSIINSATRNITCDDDYIKEVTQTYLATDDYGNTSFCSQSIMLKRFDMSSIVWPSNFELVNSTNLTCAAAVDDDGFPALSAAGVPTSNGVSIFPYDDLFCNIGVEYTDVEVIAFGCARKIMRTWYVYEWACNSAVELNHVQLIEIADTELPVITNCPPSLIYDADVSAGCSRTLELELPTVTDDCSGLLEIDVKYDGGFVNNATTNPTVTLSGSSTVTYTVYDNCDNSSTCSTLITVRDNVSPTAVCDRNSVVSLRSDGTATAFVETFDDGSSDDCNLYKSLIKRVSNTCDCDRPTFSDLEYL